MPPTKLGRAPRRSSAASLRLHTEPPRLGESISSTLDRAGSLWNRSRQAMVHEITGMSLGKFGDPDWIPDARARRSLASALNVSADHLAKFAAASGRTSLLMSPAIRHAYCPLCFERHRSDHELPGFQLDWGRLWLTHCRVHLTPLFDWKATGRQGDRQMPPEWFMGRSSFRAAPRLWLNRHLKQARWYARIDPHRGEAYEQWKALLKFETALYCMGIGNPKEPPDEVGLTYEEVLSQLATLLLAKPWNREHPLPAFKLDPQFCDKDVFHLPAFELASRHATSSLRSRLSFIAGRRALILFVANVLGAVDHPLRFTYVRPSPSPGSRVWFDILLSLIRNRERGMEILAKADAYRQAATSSGGVHSCSDEVSRKAKGQRHG